MSKILVLYSTTDGHTIEICKRIGRTLETRGHSAELCDLQDGPELGDFEYDKIVIGASIRYGKHQPLVTEFIASNQETLERHPNAFFSVNVVARKPEKNQPETNPYLQKFLKKISWQPQQLGVFAGKIDYPSLGFVDKQMIRLIMRITKGPTDTSAVFEFTDWDKVDEFAETIARL